MEAGDGSGEIREVFPGERAVGRPLSVEGVARLPRGPESDHREGGRVGHAGEETGLDPFRFERGREAVAEGVGGDPGEEGGRPSEPGEPHRDVER